MALHNDDINSKDFIQLHHNKPESNALRELGTDDAANHAEARRIGRVALVPGGLFLEAP